MSLSIVLPVVVALVGLVLWLLVEHAKRAEVGRIMFAVGLLVALAHVGGRALHLGVS